MKKFIILFISILIASKSLYSNNPLGWEQINGPYGGIVGSFAVSNNKIFVGTNQGIYSSTNNGVNWDMASYGLMNYQFYDLAAEGNNIIANSEIGSYYSSNGGNTWQRINFNGGNYEIRNSIFYGTGYGVFISSDYGINWNCIGLNNNIITSILPTEAGLYVGVYGGIRFTSDLGQNWSTIGDFLPQHTDYVTSIATTPSGLFAGSGSHGIFRSTDNGLNWAPINGGLTNIVIRDLESVGNILFTATNDGIFKSENNGENWQKMDNGLPYTRIHSICKKENNLFIGTNGGGVFFSSSYGNTWEERNNGICGIDVISLAYSGNNLFAGSSGGVFTSIDNGQNWNLIGATNIDAKCIVASGNDLWVGTDNGIYHYKNNGTNWTQFNIGLIGTHINSIIIKGENIFAAINGGVYLSTDGGENWVNKSNGLAHLNVYLLSNVGNNICLAAYGSINGAIYVSTDLGENWVFINNLELFPKALTAIETNLFLGSYFGIQRSTNYGLIWTTVNNGLGNNFIRSFTTKNSFLFAGTADGLFYSANLGSNWSNLGVPITGADIYSLATSDEYLFAGINVSGVWRYPISSIVSVEEQQSKIITSFNLLNNYPNPFNPSTKISWQAPVSGWQTLKIYDVLGNEVATLVDEYRNSGSYEIEFKSTVGNHQLANGVYFYQLQSGDYLETKKMILLK